MPRRIRLTFPAEGIGAVAELLEDEAPATCAALWDALPARGTSHHAIYSGSECVLLLPELVRVGPENATTDVRTGDVCFVHFAPGSSSAAPDEFSEICWFYGDDARPSMPEGPVPVNRFARIVEGGEAFYAVCRRMRREGVKPLSVERVAADAPARPAGAVPADLLRLLADPFALWQTPYGRPDPLTSPFVTAGRVISTQFHSPTYLAFGLYETYRHTGELAYKHAADRYIVAYLAAMRDPPTGGQRLDYPSYPFQYGMALAGYEAFRRYNPDEDWFEGKASAIYEWLLQWRWHEGSYFRNSYGSARHDVVDSANTDDNCHMGRGLIGYHAVSGRKDVLHDAEGLARYYLTEARVGSYDGAWSSALGTWVVAPTIIDSFEHFRGQRSFEMGWGFTSTGAVEFLCRLAGATERADLKARIREKCVRSMQWQFDACQFDDGACGMRGRDDKWLGMTAGAILSFLRTRDAGFLDTETATTYREKAAAARDWLLAHATPGTLRQGGYFRVTGDSEPRPPENQAWQLGWTMEALARLDQW